MCVSEYAAVFVSIKGSSPVGATIILPMRYILNIYGAFVLCGGEYGGFFKLI
ncbi:MAG: hypothetical protein R6V23_04525 [Bacteroidales bacterium]